MITKTSLLAPPQTPQIGQCAIIGSKGSEVFNKALREIYTRALNVAEQTPLLVDDAPDKIAAIYTSSIAIADISDQDVSTYYLLGMAHAMGRSPIICIQKGLTPPFDVHHIDIQPYEFGTKKAIQASVKRIVERIGVLTGRNI